MLRTTLIRANKHSPLAGLNPVANKKDQLEISSLTKRREVTDLKALPKYMQKRAEKYGWNTPDRIAPNVGPLVPGLPVYQSTRKQRSLEFIGWILIFYGIYELGEIMKDFAAKVPTKREKQDLERYQKARDLLMSKDLKESEKQSLSLENFEMPILYNIMANDGIEFYVVLLYILGGFSLALRVIYLSFRA
ncbi:Oidioi.mRNA.OKI2018_I69.PAR.g13148.t1.cds [Oikopleura dioica]|uniref:Oidioi.mRNA.OKI2018_I69.PAR.g13148.t1.cds n=1 Tax=Oikopleura dioica TaxID=34765 RepID=A0ABN7S6G6_OIKDI|nr:Oidioi.mRNA.OKI2018_I69.PAR.g13148.t1.cds [Oikopleura dioica]